MVEGMIPRTPLCLTRWREAGCGAGEDMWRYIDLRRRARPNARLSAAGGATRDGPVRDGRGKARAWLGAKTERRTPRRLATKPGDAD